ncbi:CatA-like O-acetyltransferase [Haloimpatiens sp. FM7315]|uniref:CatA-like O-acetyltransferase n=1 Tax=Haloimpatiens sp. FM7315 TaxID=3298609 RepID=UPI0039778975
MYNSAKTLNSIKEFRLRIRGEKVVLHEIIHPSVTTMSSNGVFNFCALEYLKDFHEFFLDAKSQMEKTKNNIQIENKASEDNRMYITSLPWVSYTSVNHPINMNPVSSVPIITWGKFFKENDKILIPFSLQVHHALIDGAVFVKHVVA